MGEEVDVYNLLIIDQNTFEVKIYSIYHMNFTSFLFDKSMTSEVIEGPI